MEKRLSKLEDHFDEMQKLLYKMSANIESINLNIWKAITLEERVIRLDERQKVNEKRFIKIEEKQESFQKNINWINLKIAMVSGAWTVIMFMISKL